jgi:phosphoribosylformimino-5-aminoimidazole carboxamide ribotide isomerase
MLIIPAIDIKEGKIARLIRGREEYSLFYSQEPIKIALTFEKAGAQLLHIVDLDATLHEDRRNTPLIKELVKGVRIPVQLAGGMRTAEAVEEAFKIGASKVVLSTMAYRAPSQFLQICKEFKGRIVLSVDQIKGKVYTEGWKREGEGEVEFAKKFEDAVSAILYTDIEADGTMSGPDIERVRNFCSKVHAPVMVAGGVRSVEDIRRLSRIKNVYGIVIGRALYEGIIRIEEALDACKEDNSLP